MSLRARLLLAMGMVALVLLATAGAISRLTERSLVEQLDEQLVRAAPQLRPDRRAPGLAGDAQRPPSALYVGIVELGTGELRTLFAPGTTASDAPPDLDGDEAVARLDGPAFTVAATAGDLRYRARVRELPRQGAALVTAVPMEDVDATLDRLRRLLALGSLAIVGALGLVTWWVLRLGVRPIREMTGAAVAIGDGDLSQRIPDSASGTEAAELGDALNRMLGRIEAAFDERARTEERLRRFAADASHELRTPLATIRGYAELYRHGGLADDAALADAMRRTEQEAERMSVLVNDLLALARFDQGRPVAREPVDLAGLAADAVADARAVEPSRPIELLLPEPPEPTVVAGDEGQLRQVLANLLGNVRAHTAPDAAVTVAVTADRDAGLIVLEVRDHGAGMDAEAADRAFERFYRADPSRTRGGGGAGLGLAIVAAVVEAHHGTVELTSRPGAGTTVRIALPAQQV
jgi:two-component system OmpR family sensor kinase